MKKYYNRTAIECINDWYPKVDIIVKNRGNSIYYVKYEISNEICYDIVSKMDIVNAITRYEHDERKIKLISLRIFNE